MPEIILKNIIVIRGQKVMLDADLANLYGVSTKRLNEQVRGRVSEARRIRGAPRRCDGLSLPVAPNPTGFCGPSETWVYNPRRGRRG